MADQVECVLAILDGRYDDAAAMARRLCTRGRDDPGLALAALPFAARIRRDRGADEPSDYERFFAATPGEFPVTWAALAAAHAEAGNHDASLATIDDARVLDEGRLRPPFATTPCLGILAEVAAHTGSVELAAALEPELRTRSGTLLMASS